MTRICDHCDRPEENRESGFTLLEILVGLMVFSLILLALEKGTQTALMAFDRQRAAIGSQGELEAVDGFLRRLIAHADAGGIQGSFVFSGRPQGFVLRGILPLSLGGSNDAMADFRLGVDAFHRLTLSWTPYRHIRDDKISIHNNVILNKIDHIECHYLTGTQWAENWSGNGLPSLIKLRFVFPSGDARHWPDIVAAPLLAQTPG